MVNGPDKNDKLAEIDKLIEGFGEIAGEADELSQDIKATEVPPEDDPDAVIRGGAETLSRVFEAAGVPSKDPVDIEQRIKQRQRSLGS